MTAANGSEDAGYNGGEDADRATPTLAADDRRSGFIERRYELFLALRYLKARRKQAFTSLVSGDAARSAGLRLGAGI